MLALTRRKGDSIIIGDNIQVTIISVQGEQVKIGIEAPKDVAVYRKEIYDQIISANKEATNSPDLSSIEGIFGL